MLIKLKENWQLWGPGAIVDVYYGIGKELIRDGKGFDTEKPEFATPGEVRQVDRMSFRFPIEPELIGGPVDNLVRPPSGVAPLGEDPGLDVTLETKPEPKKVKKAKAKKAKKKDTSFDLH